MEKKKQREELLAQEDAENKSQAAKKGRENRRKKSREIKNYLKIFILTGVQKPPKLTRAQIREDTEKTNNIEKPKEEVETHLTTPLEENINRVVVEGVEARTVDEALSVLRYLLLYFWSHFSKVHTTYFQYLSFNYLN